LSSKPTRLTLGALTLAVIVGPALTASSMPRLMDLYNAHPRALAQNREKCVICHTNQDGSGKLTMFGHKYEQAGLEFTEPLVKEYPNLFDVNGASPGSSAGSSPPANPGPPSESKAGPAPTAPAWTAAAYFRAECQNCHGKLGDGDPLQGVPAWATKKWLETRSTRKAELVDIILKGKDKMIGHAGKITEAQAIELYVMIVEIAKKNS
jgi:mono/diheme cytochrome c family protein